MNRASLIRLVVLIPILAAAGYGFLFVRVSNSTGREAGQIEASAAAASVARGRITGTPILVPVPEGFVALDPFRPDHARLWGEVSPLISGVRVIVMLVPESTLTSDGAVPADAARPTRLVFAGVPHALDDLEFDGAEFRYVRKRLAAPIGAPTDPDPAGESAAAGVVPDLRLAQLAPEGARRTGVARNDADEFRATVSWTPEGSMISAHASVGVVHTASRVMSISAIAIGDEDAAEWSTTMGRYIHRYARAAPPFVRPAPPERSEPIRRSDPVPGPDAG